MPLASAFVQSCADGVLGMLNLCGMVVLFSSLMGILQSGGAQSMFENLLTGCGVSKAAASSILPILFEVTGGCNRAANAGASYELMAFAIGWGGLCVHFQVYSAVGELPSNGCCLHCSACCRARFARASRMVSFSFTIPSRSRTLFPTYKRA